jgi:NhaP-type Na+/H+ or K+/H+ antiporter
MSLMIEIVSFVGGTVSEYAQRKRWSSLKIFTVTFSAFFIPFTLYFLLYPPVKGLLFGACAAAVMGLTLGVVNAALIRYAITRKQKNPEHR